MIVEADEHSSASVAIEEFSCLPEEANLLAREVQWQLEAGRFAKNNLCSKAKRMCRHIRADGEASVPRRFRDPLYARHAYQKRPAGPGQKISIRTVAQADLDTLKPFGSLWSQLDTLPMPLFSFLSRARA